MRMIRLSIGLFLLLICQYSGLMAQAPQKMSYQAVLRNSSAELVVNTTVGMRISIIQGSESGIEVYAEVQKPKTNANGLITISIGTGTVLRGTFSGINWGNGPYFIKTETDPYGGASYTITGFSQFMSVPYALFAANSGSATGATGKSAYEIWKEQPGNTAKTEADFLAALRGTDGRSAYQVWLALSGNTAKTENDFIEAIRGASGKDGINGKDGLNGIAGRDGINGKDGLNGAAGRDGVNGKDGLNGAAGRDGVNGKDGLNGIAGRDGINGKDGLNGIAGRDGVNGKDGEKGESVYDIWKKDPANNGKSEADFLSGIKAVKGDKGDKGDAGERGKDGLAGKDGKDGLAGKDGEKGESVYDIWKKDPANDGKSEADFLSGIKAVKGDKGDAGERGVNGLDGLAGKDGKDGKDGLNGKDGLAGKDGEKGESVYDIWKKDPANDGKSEADFLSGIKAVKGDKGDAGERGVNGLDGLAGKDGKDGKDGLNGKDGLAGKDGEKGESIYDIWKKDPANEGKSEADFLSGIKAVKGDKGDAGERGVNGLDGFAGKDGKDGKDGIDGLAGKDGLNGKDGIDGFAGKDGEKGESVYETWKKNALNKDKTETDFLEAMKGVKGNDGKSAFELWKEKKENENKSEADYEASLKGLNGKTILNGVIDPLPEQGQEGDFFINTATLTFFGPKANDGTWAVGSLLKGTNGVGLDFKGSYVNLAAYEAAGNLVETNKAYYNATDKKSYLYDGSEWKVFAQDGSGTESGGLNFNVDRNITRSGLPGFGTNMGSGKTAAQFLEDYFFPRLSATPPSAVLSAVGSIDIPYATWKKYKGFSTTLNLNYSVTNKSKQDDTEDKNISSIRLLSAGTEITAAVVNNTVNPQTGSFGAVTFTNPDGAADKDYSKSFQIEVKDEQPNTVTSNTLTAFMRKANRITLSKPTVSPAQYVYEYGTADIPLTLNWTFNTGDELVQGISVNNVSTGSLTTVSQPVIFKAIANGGQDSQSYKVEIKGDIYGITSDVSLPVKWESTLYRGTISSAIEPCDNSFSIADSQINKNNTTNLGGSWKNATGYDFVCDNSGKYVFFAYPDDGAKPVVEYYDANFNVWQKYPDNQMKVITKANFENASGFKGKSYKLVFVCVEYKNVTVKIRIN